MPNPQLKLRAIFSCASGAKTELDFEIQMEWLLVC
jgi:hypothetical protein